jgi:hypothetical protein
MSDYTKWLPWQKEMAGLAVLYRISVVGEEIPLVTMGSDYDFIEILLSDMSSKSLLIPGKGAKGTRWVVAPKGQEAIRTAIRMYDHLLKFEIFAKIDITRSLGEGEAHPDNPTQAYDNVYDPRFGDPNQKDQPGNWEDMRLAVMTFLSTASEEVGELNPYKVVFLQKLAAGALMEKDFWFNLRLGTVFDGISAIVDSAIKWRDVAESEADAVNAMRLIYTAGMLEQRKRDGKECTNCGTPLAIYAAQAVAAGKTLDTCPNPECQASFNPPPKTGLECPNCHSDIDPSQTICACGARLDYSLPPGTVQNRVVEEVVEETEVVWGTYYDPLFVPYGYYDPWTWSVGDALAFGIVCAVLW